MARPILTGERMITIVAMVLCHVQLVVGVILYLQNMRAFDQMEEVHQRFWKFEHAGSMILAIALITVGRVLSKRAKEEQLKQRHITIFYGIGLALMLWATGLVTTSEVVAGAIKATIKITELPCRSVIALPEGVARCA